jgi:hypothetical protein
VQDWDRPDCWNHCEQAVVCLGQNRCKESQARIAASAGRSRCPVSITSHIKLLIYVLYQRMRLGRQQSEGGVRPKNIMVLSASEPHVPYSKVVSSKYIYILRALPMKSKLEIYCKSFPAGLSVTPSVLAVLFKLTTPL